MAKAAIFEVPADGHPRPLNGPASHLIGSGRLLSRQRNGRIRFRDAHLGTVLSSALRSLSSGVETGSVGFVARNATTNTAYYCRLGRFDPATETDWWPHGVQKPAAFCHLLTITRVERDIDTAKTLRRSYNLTATEAEIAVRFSEGLTLRDIASNRNVSLPTVRNQIKSVMQKMGIHRQVEIVKVIDILIYYGLHANPADVQNRPSRTKP